MPPLILRGAVWCILRHWLVGGSSDPCKVASGSFFPRQCHFRDLTGFLILGEEQLALVRRALITLPVLKSTTQCLQREPRLLFLTPDLFSAFILEKVLP